MVVQWINWNPPNPNGNFELEIQHVNGLQDALDNIEIIKGDKGDPGENGIDGINGTNGTNGVDGRDGIDGVNGQDGYTPVKGVDYFDGKDGIDGRDGTNGLDGKDGRDGIDGANGIDGKDGKDGEPGIIYVNDQTKQLKLWNGRATLETTLGTFSVNYSEANFSAVISVQAQILGSGQLQADFPIAVTINDNYTNTSATGKAFKATSAGLLAAMQQTPAEPGTKVDIVVIGY